VHPTTLGYVAQYAAVAFLGGFVGLSELVSRYRDKPWKAVSSLPGAGYVLLNVAAATGALGLTLTYDWKFGATGSGVVPTRLLVAGFGAMALFRSSLFTVRVGNSDVGIGPASVLSVVMGACDRAVDRDRGADRAATIPEIMGNVSFKAAEGSLPAVALGLMQNLPPPDQAALGVTVDKLRHEEDMTERQKALLLGLAIETAVGAEVLKKAKEALGDEILVGYLPAEDGPGSAGEDGGNGDDAPPAGDPPPAIPGTDAQARREEPLPQTPQTPER
jgi:hypothetical protein